MRYKIPSIGPRVASLLGALALSVTSALASTPASIPPATAIPIQFVHSVDANKVHPGDQVIAKTMQVVMLPDGQRLAKGTSVKGHVVEVRPYHSGSGTNPQSKTSLLTIHFDQIEAATGTIPVSLSVRAMANSLDSDDASTPYRIDETDRPGNLTLIGGGEFSPLDKVIRNNDGDIIGYNRRDGVFAKLLDSEDMTPGSNYYCEGTNAEQSVAIFAPTACGLYGFGDDIVMTEAGGNGSGGFTLRSEGHSIKLYAGTAALLQQTETH